MRIPIFALAAMDHICFIEIAPKRGASSNLGAAIVQDEEKMQDRRTLTVRLPVELRKFIKIRAILNDRSVNQELIAIVRDLKTKEAEESQLTGTNSSASEQ